MASQILCISTTLNKRLFFNCLTGITIYRILTDVKLFSVFFPVERYYSQPDPDKEKSIGRCSVPEPPDARNTCIPVTLFTIASSASQIPARDGPTAVRAGASDCPGRRLLLCYTQYLSGCNPIRQICLDGDVGVFFQQEGLADKYAVIRFHDAVQI